MFILYYLLVVKNFDIILNSIGKCQCHVWTNILKYKVMTVITGDGQPRDTICQLNLSFVARDLIKMMFVTKLEGRGRRRHQPGRELKILIAVGGGGGLLITGHCGHFVRAEAAVRAWSVRGVVITGQGCCCCWHLGSLSCWHKTISPSVIRGLYDVMRSQ